MILFDLRMMYEYWIRMKDMVKFIVVFLMLVLTASPSLAQGDVTEQADGYEWPGEQAVLDKLSEWQDLKFGVILHWGLYAVPGIVESWSICDENWITRDTTMTYQQYMDWYFALADKFLPLLDGRADVLTAEHKALVAGREESDEIVALVFYGEMQGSHVAGHRDAHVVGIDGEGSGGLLIFRWQLCRAGREQNEKEQQIS